MNLFYFTLYALLTVMLTMYFDLISQRYYGICLVGTVLSGISWFGTFFTYESPIWLLRSGKCEQAKEVLTKISDFNGVNCDCEIRAIISDFTKSGTARKDPTNP
jgi:hypothetical protein